MIPVERYPIRAAGKDVLTSCGSLACRATTDEDAALIAAELNAALSLRAVNAELVAALRACAESLWNIPLDPLADETVMEIADSLTAARAAIARAEGAEVAEVAEVAETKNPAG